MQLTDEQKSTIRAWIEEGADLSAIQKRLKEELGISITYLETRLLADDLKLTLKEKEEPAPSPLAPDPAEALPASPPGKVSVRIDQITRPGAIVSGGVTFSDGQKAMWYLDQMGRLALDPETPGYRPSQDDIRSFQVELESAARSQGL